MPGFIFQLKNNKVVKNYLVFHFNNMYNNQSKEYDVREILISLNQPNKLQGKLSGKRIANNKYLDRLTHGKIFVTLDDFKKIASIWLIIGKMSDPKLTFVILS